MDLYCMLCGEPYDLFHVQDEMRYRERLDFKAGKGCPACDWGKKAPAEKPFRAQLASEIAILSGDDIDGLASDMEDAAMFFGSEFWDD